MQILRVIGVGLVGVLLANMLKQDKPEWHLALLVATGAMLLVIILSSMTTVINAFAELLSAGGVDNALFAGVLKIVGVGYLTEYAASVCTDAGARSIADKIQLAGKITVFLMGLPIVTALVKTVSQLL
jgi:stage III sporulation protein AD